MIPACKEQVEPQQNKALIDFDSIIFSIIFHHEHNFDLFSEKSTVSIICTLASFATQYGHLLIMLPICYGPWSALQANLSNKTTFLVCLKNCQIHGTWIPLVVTQDSFRSTQRMCVTRSNTQDGANYALLKFLDVKWINMFAIYLLVVRLLSCCY